MSIGIIELNDAGLRVGSTEAAELLHESLGLAVLEGENLLLGAAAMAQSRLHPLQSNSWFWHRLSMEPLPLRSSHYRHHADLAYGQLLALHQSIPECKDIIFALPATYTHEQMALLLGIVEQCSFRAVGLVDSAVAASAHHVRRHKAVHLDLQLHQCVLTELELTDGYLHGQRVEVLPGLGLLDFWDRWAKTIADQFIDQCRFDPLHSAPSEQSLYDQLPQWMAGYGHSDELFMEVSGKSIKLTRAAFVRAVAPLYEQIDKRRKQLGGPDLQLLVSDRLKILPGLSELLRRDGQLVETLPADAVLHCLQKNAASIVQDGVLHFNRMLPGAMDVPDSPVRDVAPTAAPKTEEEPSFPVALHLLVDHRAYPINSAPLYLNREQGRIVADESEADCLLLRQDDAVLAKALGSGAALDQQLLRPGDRLGAFQLIEVLQGYGTTR